MARPAMAFPTGDGKTGDGLAMAYIRRWPGKRAMAWPSKLFLKMYPKIQK